MIDQPLPPGTPVIVTDAAIGPDSWWSPRECYINLSMGYWLYPNEDVFSAADYAVVPRALLREVIEAADEVVSAWHDPPIIELGACIDALRPFVEEKGQ